MKLAVLRLPNPLRHVVPVTTEALRQGGIGVAVQQVKRLHGAPFGDRDANLTHTASPPHRRLLQHTDVLQATLKLLPERGGFVCGHVECQFITPLRCSP